MSDDAPDFHDPAMPAEAYYDETEPARPISIVVPSDISITVKQAREFAAALLLLADYAEKRHV